MIRPAVVFKGELRTLLLNLGDPLSSLAHFLNSDLQGSPKFTRALKSTRAPVTSTRQRYRTSHQWLVSSSDLQQGGKRSDLRMGDKGEQAAAKAAT